ncbi:DUF58 domain-containing protein [Anatilimnocola aggregata]|uniref:DUF58 domain-containing protein n=1 Tax=Anatilimnocola aggregata TaxID=2528021 RepID=UPI00192E33CB|nr:DUF58 domain-containing protein [Anatilimnocola aggregata]
MLGTRAFRAGDLLRHVHWAQTARQGKLIVAERQANLSKEVRVSFDTDTINHFGVGTNASFEWAIRIAASFCQTLLRHDIALTLVAGDQRIRPVAGEPGQQQLLELFARLKLQDDGDFSDGGKIPSQTRGDRLSPALEIVITTERGIARWSQEQSANRIVVCLQVNEGQHGSTETCLPVIVSESLFESFSSQWQDFQRRELAHA